MWTGLERRRFTVERVEYAEPKESLRSLRPLRLNVDWSSARRERKRFVREEVVQIADGNPHPRIAGRLIAVAAHREERAGPRHVRLELAERFPARAPEIEARRELDARQQA